MLRHSLAVAPFLLVSAFSAVPSVAQETCRSLGSGAVDPEQSATWRSHMEQRDPAVMADVAGTWIGQTLDPDGSRNLITVIYSEGGDLRLSFRQCGADLLADCSEMTGSGNWAAHRLPDGSISMARRFDLGESVREFCDADSFVLRDPDVAVTSSGAVAYRLP